MRQPCWRNVLVLLSAALAATMTTIEAADFTATWDPNQFLESWQDPAFWTFTDNSGEDPPLETTADFPNNSVTETFDVVISDPSVGGNATLDVPGGVTINNLTLHNSFISGDQPLTLVGEAGQVSTWSATGNSEYWNTGGLTVAAGAVLEMGGSGDKALGSQFTNGGTVDTVTLTVEGEVDWLAGDLNARGEGAAIEIAATGVLDWQAASNSELGPDLLNGPVGLVHNAGTFVRSAPESGVAGTVIVRRNWTFENDGVLSVEAGTMQFANNSTNFTNDGSVQVSGVGTTLRLGGGTSGGTFDVAASSVLTFNTSSIVSKHTLTGSGAVITNAGTVNIEGYVDFNSDASMSGAGVFNMKSGVLGGDAPLAIEALNWSGGSIVNTGGITIPSTDTATVSGNGAKGLSTGGLLTIVGTTNVTGGGAIYTTAPAASPANLVIAEDGLLDIHTDADLTDNNQGGRGGVLANSGTLRKSIADGLTVIEAAWQLENQGTLDVDTGTLAIESDFLHTGTGAIDVAADATLRFVGDVSGENDFAGEGLVRFDGTYAPGLSPAVVDFAGDVRFSAGSVLEIEIGGAGLGEYDALSIVGDLTFLGTLDLSFIELEPEAGIFAASPGDTFTLLTWGGELAAGDTFASTALPADPPMAAWSLDVVGSSLVLALSEVLENGDFNGDGTVDLADYTVWRDNLGRTGELLVADGDANGDGVVDTADYGVWKSQFGSMPGAGSAALAVSSQAVPEPASWIYVLLVLGGVAVRRRGH